MHCQVTPQLSHALAAAKTIGAMPGMRGIIAAPQMVNDYWMVVAIADGTETPCLLGDDPWSLQRKRDMGWWGGEA
jgi:hypothetical protein